MTTVAKLAPPHRRPPSSPGFAAAVAFAGAVIGAHLAWGVAFLVACVMMPKTIESARDFGVAVSGFGRLMLKLDLWLTGANPGQSIPGWMMAMVVLELSLVAAWFLGRPRRWTAVAAAAFVGFAGVLLAVAFFAANLELVQSLAAGLQGQPTR